MKYFIIFGLVIFLGVIFFLPVLRHFISPGYWEGLSVVPVMMVAELCVGVFFNLSLWYKLTDRTRWGMYLSLLCFAIMLTLNVVLVRAIGIPGGYMGAAWAALGAYFIVMVVSYFLGRRFYPINYPLGTIAYYVVVAAVFYAIGVYVVQTPYEALTLALRALLLIVFVAIIFRREKIKLPDIAKKLRRR